MAEQDNFYTETAVVGAYISQPPSVALRMFNGGGLETQKLLLLYAATSSLQSNGLIGDRLLNAQGTVAANALHGNYPKLSVDLEALEKEVLSGRLNHLKPEHSLPGIYLQDGNAYLDYSPPKPAVFQQDPLER